MNQFEVGDIVKMQITGPGIEFAVLAIIGTYLLVMPLDQEGFSEGNGWKKLYSFGRELDSETYTKNIFDHKFKLGAKLTATLFQKVEKNYNLEQLLEKIWQ